MIKCKLNKKKNYLRLKVRDSLPVVTTETLALIQSIYEGIVDKSPKAAEEYKNALIGVLLDPNSPIFKKGADLYE